MAQGVVQLNTYGHTDIPALVVKLSAAVGLIGDSHSAHERLAIVLRLHCPEAISLIKFLLYQ
jgi:hypothetical protein